jgi:hypothetical protein
VNNNPLNGIDPSGFEDLTDLAAGSAEEDPYNEMGGVGNGSSENSQAGTDIQAPTVGEAASSASVGGLVSGMVEVSIALNAATVVSGQVKDELNKSWTDKVADVGKSVGGAIKDGASAVWDWLTSDSSSPPTAPTKPPQAKTESHATPTASQHPAQNETAKTEAAKGESGGTQPTMHPGGSPPPVPPGSPATSGPTSSPSVPFFPGSSPLTLGHAVGASLAESDDSVAPATPGWGPIGYVDLNVAGGVYGPGGTGGVFLTPGDTNPYAGMGLMTPGAAVSVTASPMTPSPGMPSFQLQGAFNFIPVSPGIGVGPTAAFGWDAAGMFFWEAGVSLGTPGGSTGGTLFHTW